MCVALRWNMPATESLTRSAFSRALYGQTGRSLPLSPPATSWCRFLTQCPGPWQSIPPMILISGGIALMGGLQMGVHEIFKTDKVCPPLLLRSQPKSAPSPVLPSASQSEVFPEFFVAACENGQLMGSVAAGVRPAACQVAEAQPGRSRPLEPLGVVLCSSSAMLRLTRPLWVLAWAAPRRAGAVQAVPGDGHVGLQHGDARWASVPEKQRRQHESGASRSTEYFGPSQRGGLLFDFSPLRCRLV